ncbi:MAG: 50S ribosomal protein L28 [Firmicutes bacterium]|nr:50S ribosomal protein L28 [Bacillota bacterium]
MSRVCEICGKGPATGNQVSHSHRKTKRRWLPNLQKAKILKEGISKSMVVCTRCIRSQKVKSAVPA